MLLFITSNVKYAVSMKAFDLYCYIDNLNA